MGGNFESLALFQSKARFHCSSSIGSSSNHRLESNGNEGGDARKAKLLYFRERTECWLKLVGGMMTKKEDHAALSPVNRDGTISCSFALYP